MLFKVKYDEFYFLKINCKSKLGVKLMALKNKTKEFVLGIVVILLYLISDMVLKNMSKDIYDTDKILMYSFIKNFILSVIFILFSLFLVKKHKNNIGVLKIAIITILAFVFMEIIRIFVIGNFIKYFFHFESKNSIFMENLVKSNYYFVFETIVLIPIVEEFVFRKAIFGDLYDLHQGCNKYVRFMTSFLISGIFFCSIHDGVFAPSAISHLFGSLIYSSLYLYTKSIIPSIIAHGLHNSVFVIVTLL